MARSAFFIDGFNLYHSINDLGKPYLKWTNYFRMCELIKDKDDEIALIFLATAYYPDHSKKVRHERHVKALINCGVTVELGHYVKEDASCNDCGRTWKKPTEKESDINVALAVLDEAYRNSFDKAYVITADTDQSATFKLMRKRFESKGIISVSPPGRAHSQHILQNSTGKVALTEDIIDRSVFPKLVSGPKGSATILRPFEYDPPEGWAHPDDRPKR